MTEERKDVKFIARFLTDGMTNEIEFETYNQAEEALAEPYSDGIIPDYQILEVTRTITEKVVFTTKVEEKDNGEVKSAPA